MPQYDVGQDYTLIYFYDGPEVHWCRIWNGDVPADIAADEELADEYDLDFAGESGQQANAQPQTPDRPDDPNPAKPKPPK